VSTTSATRSSASAQPHDGLVRYAFSTRVHAKGLLKAVLPAGLVSSITWRTLKLEKDSFVDPDLRKRFADLLFSVRIRGVEVRVYILLEHQRGVEVLMMLRVLGYLTRIWERIVRDDPRRQKIPAIVPVLIHNGEHGWTAETSFEKVVDLPERARDALRPHTPSFEARLVDLGPEHATALEEAWLTAFGKLVLWALSVTGDNPRFLAEIDRMQGAIAEALAAPHGYEALAVLLRYISTTHARLDAQRFEKALTAAAGKNEAKIMMTILEELELRGVRKGERRGRVEGRAQTLLDQLAARFGSVPATAKAHILAADEPTLARWSIRVLSEKSIDAVLDGARPKRAKKTGAVSKQGRATGA
jgi:predicted transposase YdaD